MLLMLKKFDKMKKRSIVAVITAAAVVVVAISIFVDSCDHKGKCEEEKEALKFFFQKKNRRLLMQETVIWHILECPLLFLSFVLFRFSSPQTYTHTQTI